MAARACTRAREALKPLYENGVRGFKASVPIWYLGTSMVLVGSSVAMPYVTGTGTIPYSTVLGSVPVRYGTGTGTGTVTYILDVYGNSTSARQLQM